MQPDKKVLIQNWLNKSFEALENAKINLSMGMLSNAQNRLYYAIFYSTMALAYFKGFKTSKHTELLGWFNKNFIKTKIFPIEFGVLYKTAFDYRLKSDYTITFKPDKEDLIRYCEKVDYFVATIKEYVRQNNNIK